MPLISDQPEPFGGRLLLWQLDDREAYDFGIYSSAKPLLTGIEHPFRRSQRLADGPCRVGSDPGATRPGAFWFLFLRDAQRACIGHRVESCIERGGAGAADLSLRDPAPLERVHPPSVRPPVAVAHGAAQAGTGGTSSIRHGDKTMTARLSIVNFRQLPQRGALIVNFDAALRKDHAHD